MARYFKYKNLHDIRRDAERLGLPLQFADDLAPLARAVQIGPLRAGNSIAIQPMEGCDGTLGGHPDELTLRRYRRFGAGGAKIIWGEAAAVAAEARANPRQLVINDQTAQSLGHMLHECRTAHRDRFGSDSDLVVGLQLTHSGRYSHPTPILVMHDPLLDPRTIVNKSRGLAVTPDYPILEDAELERLEDRYVDAARLAFAIGFDFVDIKQCHRYLLSELLAAKTRPGRYGGSFENRTRFVRNVITKIRQAVPAGVICSRVNAYDGVPYRRNSQSGVGEPWPFDLPVQSSFGADERNPLSEDLTEPIRLLALLRELGVPMVNITMGNPYAVMHVIRPFEYAPVDGYETPEHPLAGVWRHFRITGELQKAFPDLVLVGSGYSWLQSFVYQAGAANLRDGNCRVIGLGRATLAYPDSMLDALSGKPLDPQRICRTFSYCTNLMRSKANDLGQFPTGCPPFDKDVYGPIWKEALAKAKSAAAYPRAADAPATSEEPVSLLPPGPKAPAAWQLIRYSRSPLPFLESCARRFGDPFTVRWAGYGQFVMLASPDAVQDVFRGDPHILHSGEGNEFLSASVGKNSVLVLDDEPHARQRRILLPPLKGERMRSFFDAMLLATLDVIRAWPLNQPLEMLDSMQEITLRVILQVVLGLEYGLELEEFASRVRRVLELGRGRYGLILVKILPIALLQRTKWLPFYRRMHDLDEALYAVIGKRRQQPSAQRGDNVLADLLAAFHEDGEPLSDAEIRDALVTLIFAGHDTTAVALAWSLEQIVSSPDVLQRIKDELRRTTGGMPPRAEQLNQLEYLDAAIRESLRIRTIMPFVVRLTKDVFTAGGREFPPGVVLCPCSHLVHRREDLYPEPEKFRPDRFLERRYAAHEWFPFGGGNRMCLGISFALYEMKVVLSALFATVRLVRSPGDRSNPVRRGIALAPDDGARMTVAERWS